MTFPSCGNKCTKSFIFTSSFMANHTTRSKKKTALRCEVFSHNQAHKSDSNSNLHMERLCIFIPLHALFYIVMWYPGIILGSFALNIFPIARFLPI